MDFLKSNNYQSVLTNKCLGNELRHICSKGCPLENHVQVVLHETLLCGGNDVICKSSPWCPLTSFMKRVTGTSEPTARLLMGSTEPAEASAPSEMIILDKYTNNITYEAAERRGFLISTRCEPEGHHLSLQPICSAAVKLYFLSTCMTVCQRTSHGCADEHFLHNIFYYSFHRLSPLTADFSLLLTNQ